VYQWFVLSSDRYGWLIIYKILVSYIVFLHFIFGHQSPAILHLISEKLLIQSIRSNDTMSFNSINKEQ